ncbi:MAG: IS3 family transposase [Pseudomonadota bacterium]
MTPPDPEVKPVKRRRRLTAAYKIRILEEADQCTQPGQMGALLRREGLYSSNITNWRRQRKQNMSTAMTDNKRGRKPKESNPLTEEIALLQKENARLKKKLWQAEQIIEVQKKNISDSGDRSESGKRRERVMSSANALQEKVGVKAACEALSIPRATFYRRNADARQTQPTTVPNRRPKPPLALSDDERRRVLDVLHSERFADQAPQQVYAQLLDERVYLCSIRTMYRILEKEHGGLRERRRQVVRPVYSKPELLAVAPNRVWSWDITKLKAPTKWTYYYLYVIMDIFSRYVVGWMVSYNEQTELAKRLIEQTCLKQNITAGELTLHADRGSSMKSKGVADLLVDLGVAKTHSRPHVSNDNPYSEAHFKTLKYCPQFPGTFGSLQDARSFCRLFFDWYNTKHHHSGIGLMTPEQVHYGLSQQIFDNRAQTLKNAFAKQPLRFKGKIPAPPEIPTAAWINKPVPGECLKIGA